MAPPRCSGRQRTGRGSPSPLTEGSPPNTGVFPSDLSPDGTVLIYSTAAILQESDIGMIPVDGPATAGEPLLASPARRAKCVHFSGRAMAGLRV